VSWPNGEGLFAGHGKGSRIMAGPSFLAPKSVKRSPVRRRFSLAQATKSLPLVGRVVADIVRMHTELRDLQEKAADVAGNAKLVSQAERELDALVGKLNGYIGELTDIGCELKDPQTGLVDFIGRHQGRDVHLCWKLGEETIGFWHEISAGFKGRQPIGTLEETE
jgi:hypothetical protein